MGNIQEDFLRIDRSSHSPICRYGNVLRPLSYDRHIWKVPTRFSQEDSLSFAGLNQCDLPTGSQDCDRNPRETGTRTNIEHRSLVFGARDMGGEKERLAVVPDHHLRPGFDCGQIHPLIPTNQELVVSIELANF